MDNFLEALATTVGTLLGILLAAITAYFVFLEERTSDYSDRMFDEQLAIREQLLPLHSLFFMEMPVARELIKRYQAKYPTKSRVEFISILEDRFFGFTASPRQSFPSIELTIEDEFAELDKWEHGRAWRGRLYYALLKQAVYVLAPQFQPWRPRMGTFPSSAVEIGFDQWRTLFEKMGNFVRDVSRLRQSMTEDLRLFLTPNQGASVPTNRYVSAVDGFFAAVEAIKVGFNKIDKLKSARDYKFSKLHTKVLSVLCFLSFVFGVLIPLALLTRTRPILTSWQARALLAFALVATFLSFFQFGKDVFQSVRPSARSARNSYLRMHWFQPMIDQLNSQEEKFNRRGPVDLGFFLEAKNSGDFTSEILSDLGRYIAAANEYNEKGERFTDTVFDLFGHDTTFGPIVSGKPEERGTRNVEAQTINVWTFCPYDMLDQKMIADAVTKLYEKPKAAVGLSTFGSEGTLATFVPGRGFGIPAAMLSRKQTLEGLERIHHCLTENPITLDMRRSHQALAEAESRLRKHLNDLVNLE